MARKRNLLVSLGIFVAAGAVDKYIQKRKAKKIEDLEKDVEDTTINIIVMEVEV